MDVVFCSPLRSSNSIPARQRKVNYICHLLKTLDTTYCGYRFYSRFRPQVSPVRISLRCVFAFSVLVSLFFPTNVVLKSIRFSFIIGKRVPCSKRTAIPIGIAVLVLQYKSVLKTQFLLPFPNCCSSVRCGLSVRCFCVQPKEKLL